MKMILFLGACAFLGSGAAAAPLSNAARAEIASSRVHALAEATRSVKGAAPAMALVTIVPGQQPRISVSGIADARSGATADADTPFYIASMTKAYMGLLAAELDQRKVLDLDSSLASHWPALRIEGVDTNAITLRNLLTHRLLFENNTLTFRTAYTGRVPVADYPALLASHSEPKQPGFQYDNLGYLLYAAILEQKTGRSWQDWLDNALFRPLGLTRTSARTSDFDNVTAGHQWGGKDWHVVAAKPDSIMHAAGGIVTSPRDMGRWLQASLTRSGPSLAKSSFDAAQAPISHAKAERSGRTCDGYAFGWYRCTAFGISFLEHGGGYTGFRSQMMIVPSHGAAFAVLTNSDSMTGGLSGDLMMEFLKALADPEAPGPDVAAFAASYAQSVAKQAEGRGKREAKDVADAKWQGWQWRPSKGELAAFTGRYRSDRLGEIVVTPGHDGLSASIGEMAFKMAPAAPDLFAASANPMEVRETFKFERKGDRIGALLWDERRFERID